MSKARLSVIAQCARWDPKHRTVPTMPDKAARKPTAHLSLTCLAPAWEEMAPGMENEPVPLTSTQAEPDSPAPPDSWQSMLLGISAQVPVTRPQGLTKA